MLFFKGFEWPLPPGFREKAQNPGKNSKSENELGHNLSKNLSNFIKLFVEAGGWLVFNPKPLISQHIHNVGGTDTG